MEDTLCALVRLDTFSTWIEVLAHMLLNHIVQPLLQHPTCELNNEVTAEKQTLLLKLTDEAVISSFLPDELMKQSGTVYYIKVLLGYS